MAKILFLHKDQSAYDSVFMAATPDNHMLIPISTMDGIQDTVYRNNPDLIIVDASILFNHGVNTARQLRAIPSLERIPILALTNNRAASEIAQVLDSGCDDCVRKPVIERELAARLRALLRRRQQSDSRVTLQLNRDHRLVYLNGRRLDLTPTEYDLLEMLCLVPGEHYSTSALLEHVWHYPSGKGDSALVRNHVRNLRRKLEDDPDRPRIVQCLQGRGYTINAEVERW